MINKSKTGIDFKKGESFQSHAPDDISEFTETHFTHRSDSNSKQKKVVVIDENFSPTI